MRNLRLLALGVAAASTAFSTNAAAQSGTEQLTFHGFLNQGFGVSGSQPILGLNKDASSDYRVGAVQVRFALSPVDNFVVQTVTRSLGTSPLSGSNGNVAVDWAFFHHRFDNASVRVGRIPLPFGFLAETREVGTLLPFYRAPTGYYNESFRSLDGVMVTNDLAVAGGRLETKLWGGGAHGTQLTWLPPNFPIASVTTKLRLERLLGASMVYTTPIDGIRILGGLSTLRMLDTVKVQAAPATKLTLANVGLDARFDRVFARGESRMAKSSLDSKTNNYYAQGGVRPLKNLWVNVQGDFSEEASKVASTKDYKGRVTVADRALSVSYHFAQNIVGKIEQHWVKGGIDGFVAPTAPLPNARYSLASFAVSF